MSFLTLGPTLWGWGIKVQSTNYHLQERSVRKTSLREFVSLRYGDSKFSIIGPRRWRRGWDGEGGIGGRCRENLVQLHWLGAGVEVAW